MRAIARAAGAWVRAAIALATVAGLALVAIAGPAWSETMTVELLNGDVVTGEVVERTDERIVLEHPVLGRLEIPIEQVNPRALHVGIFGTDFLAGWDKQLDVGFSGSEGDTDETDVLVGASLNYADERKRWIIRGHYELSYSENEIDDHDARVNALRDWLFAGSRWFAFSYSTYDFDEFESWKHRVTTGAGPGYRIIPEGAFQLDARFGPFYTYEFGDERNSRPELAGGLFARWKISDANTLRLNSVYFQTLDQLEFRNVTAFEWKIRLMLTKGLHLKIGIDNEYDSASEESKNNLKYYSALAFDL
jgi:putative salt-induced outer membrane protein YdiY